MQQSSCCDSYCSRLLACFGFIPPYSPATNLQAQKCVVYITDNNNKVKQYMYSSGCYRALREPRWVIRFVGRSVRVPKDGKPDLEDVFFCITGRAIGMDVEDAEDARDTAMGDSGCTSSPSTLWLSDGEVTQSTGIASSSVTII